MLAEARIKAGKRKLKLEAVLESLFVPVFRAQASHKSGGSFTRLIGRVVFDRNAELQKFMVGELAQVIIQFSRAFDEALPGLDKTEMDWRSHFMAGAMAHTLCNADLLASFTGTDAGAEGYEAQCSGWSTSPQPVPGQGFHPSQETKIELDGSIHFHIRDGFTCRWLLLRAGAVHSRHHRRPAGAVVKCAQCERQGADVLVAEFSG